jgi:hypothetical protein
MNTRQGKSLKIMGALLLVLAITVQAGTPVHKNNDLIEKTKTVNRSFTVSSGEKLDIENSFGNVDIKTWDKNEFKVDITITTKAKQEATAQKLLDDISIEENHSAGKYSFRTNTEKTVGNGHNRKNYKAQENKEFHVDYVVYMPAGNPLDVYNSFGKIFVADMKGETILDSKYGELNTGVLSNNNSINVEFGKASLKAVHGGKAVFKYCADAKLGELNGNIKLVCEFSGIALTPGNGLKDLNLISSYTTTRLDMPAGLPADVMIDCSFGECTNKTSFPLKQEQDEDNRYNPEKHYRGKSGDGSMKIKIKTNFGDVRMLNPGDKDEPRSKTKSKKDKGVEA